MAEAKKITTDYFVGEIEQQTQQGRLMIPVVARPDGTGLGSMQVQVEILNKLNQLYNLVKSNL